MRDTAIFIRGATIGVCDIPCFLYASAGESNVTMIILITIIAPWTCDLFFDRAEIPS